MSVKAGCHASSQVQRCLKNEHSLLRKVTADAISMKDIAKLDPKNYTKLYLNGEYVAAKSTDTYSLKNPKDNSLVVENIPIAGAEDVEAAVKYAEAAYRGEWGKFTALQRTECFHRLVALLEDQLIPVLTLDSLTSGNPTSLIPTREKNYIKNSLLYYAGWTDKQKGDYYPADDGMSSTKPSHPEIIP